MCFPVGDGEWNIATRGSFASDQAVHATQVWNERYTAHVKVPDGWTLLFEIVFPTNRIVVDYVDMDDLVLLGAREIESGQSVGPIEATVMCGWPGPVAETMEYSTLAEALASPSRDNREGLVVRSVATDGRVKIKYSRYVYLHKLVTGMNERVVWERVGDGETVDQLIADLPDEFHAWVVGVADRLVADREAAVRVAWSEHQDIVESLPPGWSRKDYAEKAKVSPRRGVLFMLLDDRDPRPSIWRDLRPSGAVTMVATSEAVA